MPAVMQKLAPGPPKSTAAWIDMLGHTLMASGGQAVPAALAGEFAWAGWLCVCELDAANATRAAAAANTLRFARHPCRTRCLQGAAGKSNRQYILSILRRSCSSNAASKLRAGRSDKDSFGLTLPGRIHTPMCRSLGVWA